LAFLKENHRIADNWRLNHSGMFGQKTAVASVYPSDEV